MKRIFITLKEKWPEYLIESIVIIASILGAFALDTWNQHRMDRVIELNALLDLREEFQSNLIKLEKAKRTREKGIKTTTARLEFLRDKAIDSLMAKPLMAGLGQVTLNFSDGALASLITTGQINVIQNDSLKYLISSWNGLLDDISEEDTNHFNFILEYIRYTGELIPVTIVNDPQYKYTGEFLFHNQQEIRSYYKKLTDDMHFQNLNIMNINWSRISLMEYNRLENRILQILALLDHEIALKK